jgi:hypothetical protein
MISCAEERVLARLKDWGGWYLGLWVVMSELAGAEAEAEEGDVDVDVVSGTVFFSRTVLACRLPVKVCSVPPLLLLPRS